MKISVKKFPLILVILPTLHYALFLFTNAESEAHKLRKENGKSFTGICISIRI